jgi:hypothetical protein
VNLQSSAFAFSAVFRTGCVASCTVTTCSCTQSGAYWSSSTFAGNPNIAWYVTYSGGGNSAISKSAFIYAWAVRGGP